MHVVVVASQKGGAGKTTLCRSLAVAAQDTHGPVALFDADPQGSLTSWWNRREADTPALVRLDVADIAAGLDRLSKAGIKLLLVDTPPAVHPALGALLAHASLVLLPVRPSPDDLDAIGATLEAVEVAGAPFVFVLTQAKPRTRLQVSAVTALAQHGKLAPTIIHDRTDFPTAAISGQTVTELGDTPSAREVQEVLAYVMAQLRKEGRTWPRKAR